MDFSSPPSEQMGSLNSAGDNPRHGDRSGRREGLGLTGGWDMSVTHHQRATKFKEGQGAERRPVTTPSMQLSRNHGQALMLFRTHSTHREQN